MGMFMGPYQVTITWVTCPINSGKDYSDVNDIVTQLVEHGMNTSVKFDDFIATLIVRGSRERIIRVFDKDDNFRGYWVKYRDNIKFSPKGPNDEIGFFS